MSPNAECDACKGRLTNKGAYGEESRRLQEEAGILPRGARFDTRIWHPDLGEATDGWGQMLDCTRPNQARRRTEHDMSTCVTALTHDRSRNLTGTSHSFDEYALSRVSHSPRQQVGPRQARVSQWLSLSDNFTAGDGPAARASRGRVRGPLRPDDGRPPGCCSVGADRTMSLQTLNNKSMDGKRRIVIAPRVGRKQTSLLMGAGPAVRYRVLD
jgi:hypothetical protein